QGSHQYTALLRDFRPALKGSRAIQGAALTSALLGFVWALVKGYGFQAAAVNVLMFPLAVFGSWRLGREVLPDDPAAAWISMVLAFLACLAFGTTGVVALFATLGLVKMVNRSNGLEATKLDSAVLTLLVIVTVYASASPWYAAVAALAFGFDASLKGPLRRQLLFAVLCIGTMVVYIVDHDPAWLDFHAPHTLLQWLAIVACLLLSLNLFLLKKVHSRAQHGGKRLDPDRVKAGMAIAIMGCLQGLDAMPYFILLVATIGGLCLGIAFRRSFRTTTKGLRH
ncbi:MAG TPA: hypothetical protein VFG52_11335, partial [Xanthomonadales bacterium]|nr:hypothetical protein [Xanthomonadales bacterium]